MLARHAKNSLAPSTSDSIIRCLDTFEVKVKRSRIQGLGLFAVTALPARRKLGELGGERVTQREARRRARGVSSVKIVEFGDGTALDATRSGGPFSYVNHSCEPNCEAELVEGDGDTRIYILALRDIAPDEELVYNYGLSLDERYTPTLKKQFACHCGSKSCRGTMLSPKR